MFTLFSFGTDHPPREATSRRPGFLGRKGAPHMVQQQLVAQSVRGPSPILGGKQGLNTAPGEPMGPLPGPGSIRKKSAFWVLRSLFSTEQGRIACLSPSGRDSQGLQCGCLGRAGTQGPASGQQEDTAWLSISGQTRVADMPQKVPCMLTTFAGKEMCCWSPDH